MYSCLIGTYRTPVAMIVVSPSFLIVDILKVQMKCNGNSIMITSKAMFGGETARLNLRSQQWPCLDGSILSH